MKSKSGAHGRRKRRDKRPAAASSQQPSRGPEVKPEPVRARVWDLPTRVMHWLLILLFAVLAWTGLSRTLPELHLWAGNLLLVVLLTRLVWSAIGSDSARFVHFVRGPRAIIRYLPLLLSRRPTRWPGHNPVGALYVVAILGLLLASCVTGLFYESWAEVRGPLAERVPRAWTVALSDWHGALIWPMLALVAVHVLVTLGYWLFKHENRIGPIFGDGRLRLGHDPQMRMVSSGAAFLIGLVAMLGVLLMVRFGPVI
ncbi:MAG: cytochrome b/b6 domain-containing protein [Wenzhouxiangellaceae bacterium]